MPNRQFVPSSTSMRQFVQGVAFLWSIHAGYLGPRLASGAYTASLEEFAPQKEDGRTNRWCTVDQLLPLRNNPGLSPEWSSEHVVDPPYGCDCPFLKARYFCPNLGPGGYPKWIPQAVANGECEAMTRAEMGENVPLPPGFKVLFYGNSHMRQTVESIMCLFGDKVAAKRISQQTRTPGTKYQVLVDGQAQCRNCRDQKRDMLDHGCINEVHEACSCDDDYSEYFFENGAVVHYYYPDDYFDKTRGNKSVTTALGVHGNVTFGYYDVVFANAANPPHMPMSSALDVAFKLRAERVQFLWLSTYDGTGSLDREAFADEESKARFAESGAHFVSIDSMARGLKNLTKGAVEGIKDTHFCLPGPPAEMGILLLKLAWAVYHHKEGG